MNKHKCPICNKDIDSDVLYQGDYDQINASALWPGGERLELEGHKTCLQNINELVVIQNRLRCQNIFIENLTYKAHEEDRKKMSKMMLLIYVFISLFFIINLILLTSNNKSPIFITNLQSNLILINTISALLINTWIIILYYKIDNKR